MGSSLTGAKKKEVPLQNNNNASADVNMVDYRAMFEAAEAQIAKEKQRADEEKQRADEEKQRAEAARKGQEEERQRAAEEKQRADEEKKRADEEKQRADEEKQRADEEKQRADTAFKPVKDVIANAPFTRRLFSPAWGELVDEEVPPSVVNDNVPPSNSKKKKQSSSSKKSSGSKKRSSSSLKSTTTKPSWLVITPDDVGKWHANTKNVPSFSQFLHLCDTFTTENGTRILDLILSGSADVSKQGLLNGTSAGMQAEATRATIQENNVTISLNDYVWKPLKDIMGGADSLLELFPVKQYITTRTCGGGNQDEVLVDMPPQYYRFYECDLVVETIPARNPPGATNPDWVMPDALEEDDASEEVKTTDAQNKYAKQCSRVVVEVKPDVKCPVPKVTKMNGRNEAQVAERNRLVSGHLVDYMQGGEGVFNPLYNPVAQIATYALATRTTCIMIHSLNHVTFGYIELRGEDEAKPFVWLSEKFDCSSPGPWVAEEPTWSPWEVMIRFVLSSKAVWYLEKFPAALKALFQERLEAGEEAAQRKRAKSDDGKKKDDEEEEDDGGGAFSGPSSSSSSNARTGGTNATSSSSSSGGGGNTRRSSGKGNSAPKDAFVLQRFYWADLWDPLRFAIPATHSIEEESTTEHLPGDAELLGEGRMGPAFRQTIQGRDAVVKVAIFCKKRHFEDRGRVFPTFLRDEMAVEFRAYDHLKDLQGKTIPLLLRYDRDFVPNMADALTTEYAGECLDRVEYDDDFSLTIEHARGALRALDAVHAHDVLHGDVELRNFVCGEDENDVKLIDFGFARFREDMDDEERWTLKVAEEKASLRTLLAQYVDEKELDAVDITKKKKKKRTLAEREDAEMRG